MAKILEGSFSNQCKHDGEDKVILFRNWGFAACFDCGEIYFGGDWFQIRVLIVTLLAVDEEKIAMILFRFMNKCRKKKLIKYVYVPEEELRKSAKKMKKKLKKIESKNTNSLS